MAHAGRGTQVGARGGGRVRVGAHRSRRAGWDEVVTGTCGLGHAGRDKAHGGTHESKMERDGRKWWRRLFRGGTHLENGTWQDRAQCGGSPV